MYRSPNERQNCLTHLNETIQTDALNVALAQRGIVLTRDNRKKDGGNWTSAGYVERTVADNLLKSTRRSYM